MNISHSEAIEKIFSLERAFASQKDTYENMFDSIVEERKFLLAESNKRDGQSDAHRRELIIRDMNYQGILGENKRMKIEILKYQTALSVRKPISDKKPSDASGDGRFNCVLSGETIDKLTEGGE